MLAALALSLIAGGAAPLHDMTLSDLLERPGLLERPKLLEEPAPRVTPRALTRPAPGTSAASDSLAQETARPGVSGLALCRGRYEALAEHRARAGASDSGLAALDRRLGREIARRVGGEDRLERVARVNRAAGRARIETLIYRATSGQEVGSALRAMAAWKDAMADCAGLLDREGVAGAE